MRHIECDDDDAMHQIETQVDHGNNAVDQYRALIKM